VKGPPVWAPSTHFKLFWSRHKGGESFSLQQPQSQRVFGRCEVRCAGHLNATSKAFRQQPHKYYKGRRVKLVEACPPFSFGNDTIRHFAKLSVFEHFSNWRFRTDRTHLMTGLRCGKSMGSKTDLTFIPTRLADNVRAAMKILGREAANGGKQIGRKKRVMCLRLRERRFRRQRKRAKFRAAKAKGKR
jgi:hypothetical protein